MGLFDSDAKKGFDEKLKEVFAIGDEFKVDICNICGNADPMKNNILDH